MKGLLIIISFLLWTGAHSQDNLQIQFGYRGSVAAAKFLPSTQQLVNTKFETSLEYNAWVANQSLTYESIRKIYTQKSITDDEIDKIIDEMDDDNQMGGGQDFLVLGVGYRVPIAGHPVVWSLTISDRFSVNAFFPKQLAQLVWQGNEQFVGSTLDLSKTFLAGIYFRQFSIGAASNLLVKDNWTLRGGARFSYYMGLSGVSNQRNSFSFTTAVDAEYLELDYDFRYFYTGINDFDLFDPKGHGFGGDLGATFSFKDKLNFDLGLTDLGSIKYKRNVVLLENDETVLFSGLDREALQDPESFADSITNIFEPSELPGSGFRMPIGPKFSFMTSWKFGETSRQHGPKTLYLFYRQGFSENPGSTVRPKLSLALQRPMFRYFNLGVSTSWGGFNDFAVGALIGLQFKHFRLGVHSDNINGLVAPKKATGAAAGFILQILVGRHEGP